MVELIPQRTLLYSLSWSFELTHSNAPFTRMKVSLLKFYPRLDKLVPLIWSHTYSRSHHFPHYFGIITKRMREFHPTGWYLRSGAFRCEPWPNSHVHICTYPLWGSLIICASPGDSSKSRREFGRPCSRRTYFRLGAVIRMYYGRRCGSRWWIRMGKVNSFAFIAYRKETLPVVKRLIRLNVVHTKLAKDAPDRNSRYYKVSVVRLGTHCIDLSVELCSLRRCLRPYLNDTLTASEQPWNSSGTPNAALLHVCSARALVWWNAARMEYHNGTSDQIWARLTAVFKIKMEHPNDGGLAPLSNRGLCNKRCNITTDFFISPNLVAALNG